MKLHLYTTTFENEIRNTVEVEKEWEKDCERENQLINLYPQVKYQKLDGFGGAITDSAGYVYSLMNKEQQKKVTDTYFGQDGMRYTRVRIPIDSCDFSLEHYEADAGPMDEGFEHFSFERVEKYILPLLDAAQQSYGRKLDIMLSPWSPPAYMKTNGERNHGGKLLLKYRQRYADYLCRYIMEYRKRGYQVTKLTMQNEPKAVQNWDSCVYTAAEEKEFLCDFLWPALQRNGLGDIEIYLWDHNKERVFEWAEEILDTDARDMVAGMAFHWYSGDHFEALNMIRQKYPDKKLLLSEACIEYCKFAADDYLQNAQKYAHDMIGNFCNGMNDFYDWNLLLNEEGGPNHVGNFCDAPFLFDIGSRQLKEGTLLAYLWHFTHFLQPGAQRIGLTRYTDQLEAVAFEREGKITVVMLNRTKQQIPVWLRLGEWCVTMEAEPESIMTAVVS